MLPVEDPVVVPGCGPTALACGLRRVLDDVGGGGSPGGGVRVRANPDLNTARTSASAAGLEVSVSRSGPPQPTDPEQEGQLCAPPPPIDLH